MTFEHCVAARWLGGPQRGHALTWSEVEAWRPEDGAVWVHFDLRWPDLGTWLRERAGLGESECEGLLAEDPRPRSSVVQGGLLAVLRGVNLNPGEEPEDMVSVRLWVEESRAFSLERRPVVAVRDVLRELDGGGGPKRPGELVADLSFFLVERIRPVVFELDEELDGLEERVVDEEPHGVRPRLGALRRKLIELRRHIGPQRDAMLSLWREPTALFTPEDRNWLRETSDSLMRLVEEIDEQRERATVTQEELATRVSEELNQRMLALAIVTTIFLPLGFVTGLLGINVGGMPGASTGWAFYVVCGLLLLLTVAEIWILRRKGWF